MADRGASHAGPNPAVDLRYVIGKQPGKKARKRDLQWFRQSEVPVLVAAARALRPRWVEFICLSLMTGLRRGEALALYKTHIDWDSGRLHVQRTVSGKKGQLASMPKDAVARWVKIPRERIEPLKRHVWNMDLEARS